MPTAQPPLWSPPPGPRPTVVAVPRPAVASTARHAPPGGAPRAAAVAPAPPRPTPGPAPAVERTAPPDAAALPAPEAPPGRGAGWTALGLALLGVLVASWAATLLLEPLHTYQAERRAQAGTDVLSLLAGEGHELEERARTLADTAHTLGVCSPQGAGDGAQAALRRALPPESDWVGVTDSQGVLVWQHPAPDAALEGRPDALPAGLANVVARATERLRASVRRPRAVSGLMTAGRQPLMVACVPTHHEPAPDDRAVVVLVRRVDAGLFEPLGARLGVRVEPAPLRVTEAPTAPEGWAVERVAWPGLEGPPLRLDVLLPAAVGGVATRAQWWLGGSVLLAGLLLVVGRRVLLRRVDRSEAAQRQLSRLAQAVVEQSAEGVLLLDPALLSVVQSNAAARRLAGLPSSADWPAWVAAVLGESFPWSEVLQGRGACELEVRRQGADGLARDLEVRGSRVALGGRTLVHVVLRDISERKRTEAAMRHQAYHDPLTQLPNRLLFHEHLTTTLARAERLGEPVGVLVIDLDDFKTVNDTLGHGVGDRLLVQVAERLQAAVRGGDVVARQGGDEFMVLVPRLSPGESATTLADRVLACLRAPFRVEGRELQVTASAGIAVFPEDGPDAATLFRNADVAMYHAKHTGRGGWQRHAEHMNTRAVDLLELKTELARAIEKNELSVAYQPLVDARTGEIRCLEALVRWRRPGHGEVPPARFLPVAEETGLILPLGAWVLRRVCEQQVAWRQAGLPAVKLAVNLSVRQLLEPDVLGTVKAIVRETGADPTRLEFEVTETVAIRNARLANQVFRALAAEGFSIALDDFGTGYSALVYLRQFPFDRLKIDRAFVHDLNESEGNRSIVAAVVALAHGLSMSVVAEGVESAEQARTLTELGCDLLQGYGLARPMPPEQVEALLASGRRLAVDPRATVTSLPPSPLDLPPEPQRTSAAGLALEG